MCWHKMCCGWNVFFVNWSFTLFSNIALATTLKGFDVCNSACLCLHYSRPEYVERCRSFSHDWEKGTFCGFVCKVSKLTIFFLHCLKPNLKMISKLNQLNILNKDLFSKSQFISLCILNKIRLKLLLTKISAL